MAKEVLDISLKDLPSLPTSHALSYFTPERLKELDIPTNAIPKLIYYISKSKK